MLRITTAGDTGELAARLAAVLDEPMADPMAAEWIVVATGGTQRWLRLELARRLGTSGNGRGDGVAANLDLIFPGRLTRRVLSPGPDRRSDPWDLDRVTWVVFDVLDADHGLDDTTRDGLGPLIRLAPGATAWGRARRLADLFDRYLTHRPEMIRAWAAGHDRDGMGQKISERSRWQPHLWRLVRDRIGVASPPELLPERLAALRAGDCPGEIPDRVSLFGLTTVPGGAPFLDLLDALGTQREIHLMIHEPSAALSRRVRTAVSTLSEPVRNRADDPSADAARNPLLRSWARPARETAVLLAGRSEDGTADHRDRDAANRDPAPPTSLLARVQADLRLDSAPAGGLTPAADDESIRIHSCHGNTRQVEILRDQLLHLLADDPTLTEEDIVVFCPDLDEFAPLIESVLGPAGQISPAATDPTADAPPTLNYRVTDRSLGSVYPLLGALGALVELLASRFSDAAVIDFASLGPVRDRFDLHDTDLATLADWADEANTRWGLDGAHRARWDLPADYQAGSWNRALNRLLLGVAISDDPSALAPGQNLPIAVEGHNTSVAGRIADLLGRLAALAAQAQEPRPVREWVTLLQGAARELFEVDPRMQWQQSRLDNLLEAIADAATLEGVPCDVDLTLADVRHLLGRHLRGQAGRSDFFRGGITISSLTPLRGLPYRAVCILGLDEANLTTGAPDGDDLTTTSPHIGDRDRRADTRQMLLDTVLVAGDRLVVIRNGRSVVTNQAVPAAVVVAELVDVIAATVEPAVRDQVLAHLTIVHPRQAFDEKNFQTEGSPSSDAGRTGPWSFDPLARAGAEARGSADDPRPFLPTRLAEHTDRVIDLADLREFITHPPRYFLRRVLEINLPRNPSRSTGQLVAPTTGSSGLPRPAQGRDLLLSLDGLESWSIQDRLLNHRRAGGDIDSFLLREQAGDLLPPGRLAEAALAEAYAKVEPLIDALDLLVAPAAATTYETINLMLPDGTRLVGAIRNDGSGERPGPIEVSVSNRKDTHKLRPWLDVLALTAGDPRRKWRAVLLNPARNNDGFSALGFEIDDPDPDARRDQAIEALEMVVDLYRRGHREPLPLFPRLSWALYRDNDPGHAWTSSGFSRGDSDDEWIQVAFDRASLETITSLDISDDDPPGEAADRAGRYAHHLWGTLEESAPGEKITLSQDTTAQNGGSP